MAVNQLGRYGLPCFRIALPGVGKIGDLAIFVWRQKTVAMNLNILTQETRTVAEQTIFRYHIEYIALQVLNPHSLFNAIPPNRSRQPNRVSRLSKLMILKRLLRSRL
jgi:hypothetical protein